MLPDCRVLDTLAVEMDVDLFTQTPAAAAGELARLGARTGVAPAGAERRPQVARARPASGRPCSPPGASSSTRRRSPWTSRTSRAPRGPRSCGSTPATAARLGLTEGEPATVRTERGAITLPVALADLPDGVVWLPGNSGESRVRAVLGVGHGDLVGVTA